MSVYDFAVTGSELGSEPANGTPMSGAGLRPVRLTQERMRAQIAIINDFCFLSPHNVVNAEFSTYLCGVRLRVRIRTARRTQINVKPLTSDCIALKKQHGRKQDF